MKRGIQLQDVLLVVEHRRLKPGREVSEKEEARRSPHRPRPDDRLEVAARGRPDRPVRSRPTRLGISQ